MEPRALSTVSSPSRDQKESLSEGDKVQRALSELSINKGICLAEGGLLRNSPYDTFGEC
jgi:hypothetical protein